MKKIFTAIIAIFTFVTVFADNNGNNYSDKDEYIRPKTITTTDTVSSPKKCNTCTKVIERKVPVYETVYDTVPCSKKAGKKYPAKKQTQTVQVERKSTPCVGCAADAVQDCTEKDLFLQPATQCVLASLFYKNCGCSAEAIQFHPKFSESQLITLIERAAPAAFGFTPRDNKEIADMILQSSVQNISLNSSFEETKVQNCTGSLSWQRAGGETRALVYRGHPWFDMVTGSVIFDPSYQPTKPELPQVTDPCSFPYWFWWILGALGTLLLAGFVFWFLKKLFGGNNDTSSKHSETTSRNCTTTSCNGCGSNSVISLEVGKISERTQNIERKLDRVQEDITSIQSGVANIKDVQQQHSNTFEELRTRQESILKQMETDKSISLNQHTKLLEEIQAIQKQIDLLPKKKI